MLAVAAAAEPAEEVIVIETGGAGPAAARNEGAEQATGDILVFVDSDVEIHRDALSRVRRAFEADPGLTAVFGSYDDEPPSGGVASRFRNLLHHHVHQEGAGPASTFWAGLGAIRRGAFLSAGGFDADRYRTSTMEDIELGMRISSAGGRIVLDPLLRGTHLKHWGVRDMVHADLWRRGTPWVRLMLRRGELPNALNLRWRHRVSALISMALAVSLGRGRPTHFAAALAAFLGLNRRFHRLLWRKGGARTTGAGDPPARPAPPDGGRGCGHGLRDGAARSTSSAGGGTGERRSARWNAGRRGSGRRPPARQVHLTELAATRRATNLLGSLAESDMRARYGRGPWQLFKWLVDPFALTGVYLAFVVFVLDRPGGAPGLSVACAVVPFQLVIATVVTSLDSTRARETIIANMAFPRTYIPAAAAVTESVAFVASCVLLALMMIVYTVAPTAAILWLPLILLANVALRWRSPTRQHCSPSGCPTCGCSRSRSCARRSSSRRASSR